MKFCMSFVKKEDKVQVNIIPKGKEKRFRPILLIHSGQ